MNIIILSTISGCLLLLFSFLKYRNKETEVPQNDKKKTHTKRASNYFTSEVLCDTIINLVIVFFSAFLAMWLSAHLEKKLAIENASSMSQALSQQCTNRVVNVYNKMGGTKKESEGYLEPDEALEGMIEYIVEQDISSEKALLFNDYMTSSLTSNSLLQINMYYGFMEDQRRRFEKIDLAESVANPDSREDLVRCILEYCYDSAVLSYYYEVLGQDGADTEILYRMLPEYTYWEGSNEQKVYDYLIDGLQKKYEVDLSEYKNKAPVIEMAGES